MNRPMRRHLFSLAIAVIVLTSTRLAHADSCEDLAKDLGANQKGAELAALVLGDCKDIDENGLGALKKLLESIGSVKAKEVKFPEPVPKSRLRLASGIGSHLGAAKAPADKRLGFTGKDGFPLGAADILRVDSGPFDVRVTVALGLTGLKEDSGLFDPGTSGILRLDRPPFDPVTLANSFSTGLVATYDSASQGFRVTAQDDGHSSLGTPKVIANTREVDLRMQQTATTFTLFTRATPADRSSPDGWLTVFTTALAAPTTPFSFGLVGRGLDHKGSVFFDFFRLTGPQIGGATERPLMNQIGNLVLSPLGDAHAGLVLGSPDLVAASAALQLAADGAATCQAAIAAAQTAGTLQASTQGAAALKALGKAAKGALGAKKSTDKGDATKAAKIDEKVVASARSVMLAIANLEGFKVTSLKKLPFGHSAK